MALMCPIYRLPAAEVARVWGGSDEGLPIKEKSVPGLDEDMVTMSIEASRNALARAGIKPELIRAVWVGSESHPYAVKPIVHGCGRSHRRAGAYPGGRYGVRLQGRHRSHDRGYGAGGLRHG